MRGEQVAEMRDLCLVISMGSTHDPSDDGIESSDRDTGRKMSGMLCSQSTRHHAILLQDIY